MKNKLCTGLAFLLAMMLTGCAPDKEAIEKQAIEKQIRNQVDEVVAAIDIGKQPEDFKELSKKEPYYLFIMKPDAKLLFHPRWVEVNLVNDKHIYDALVKATTEGLWVEYVLEGKMKHTYVKKTKGGLFVGSGY